MNYNSLEFKMYIYGFSLASVAQLVGCHPTNRKVASSILSQDTCLGCGFGSWLGWVPEATDRYFSLTSMILSLFFPLFPPL